MHTTNSTPQPIHRQDDNELMGFIQPDDVQSDLWSALTVFYNPLQKGLSEKEATQYVLSHGLEVLTDTWQFLDTSDSEWYNCQIAEAKPGHVVVKISDYGHPDVHKLVTIEQPDEHSIRYTR